MSANTTASRDTLIQRLTDFFDGDSSHTREELETWATGVVDGILTDQTVEQATANFDKGGIGRRTPGFVTVGDKHVVAHLGWLDREDGPDGASLVAARLENEIAQRATGAAEPVWTSDVEHDFDADGYQAAPRYNQRVNGVEVPSATQQARNDALVSSQEDSDALGRVIATQWVSSYLGYEG